MLECALCNLTPQDKKWMLYENNDWIVFLADKQDYIGRCMVVCQEHCQSISDLNIEQWISLKVIMSSLEQMLKSVLGATMFNWSCLMNDAYKADCACPHVHFHMRPRYAEPVIIKNREYRDDEFAHHYDNKKPAQITDEAADFLFAQLKEKISLYFS